MPNVHKCLPKVGAKSLPKVGAKSVKLQRLCKARTHNADTATSGNI